MTARRSRAESQRRYRQRRRDRQAVYLVSAGGTVLDMLVRLGHLADHETTNKRQVAKAISDLLADAARH
jgi:hypothetical protein